MNNAKEQLKETIQAFSSMLKNKCFMEATLLLAMCFVYLWRFLKYEFMFPVKCGNCKGETEILFLRSEQSIFGKGNDALLYDWLVCKRRDCSWALKKPNIVS